MKIGSRIQVWRGHAKQTSGGLTKAQLIKNKNGVIVSRKKHEQATGKVNNLQKFLIRKRSTRPKRKPTR